MTKERKSIELSPEIIESLDPKIRPLVAAFNQVGINTYSSCEGHLDSQVRNLRLPHPWITFNIEVLGEESSRRLTRMIEEWNRLNPSKKWGLKYAEDPIDRYTSIELFFLSPATINFKLEPEVLAEHHQQTEEMAKFISQSEF